MSEIEKMYKNADIKTLKDCKHYLRGDGNWCNDTCDIDKGQGTYSDICYLGDNHDKNDIDRLKCPYCEVEDFGYPPFTAEKQLEIENVILQNKKNYNKWIEYNINVYGEWVIRFVRTDKFAPYVALEKTRAEALANVINNLWQSLTEEEKQQVKGILE